MPCCFVYLCYVAPSRRGLCLKAVIRGPSLWLQYHTRNPTGIYVVLHMQGLLCGVLQVVIQKLSESDSAKTGLLEKADTIMQALLGVFQCDTTSVHEEAMLAVGALTYACGQSFTKYMQSFYPVLELGLKNHRVGLLLGHRTAHDALSSTCVLV